jgi:hypothetical protein
MLVSRLMFSTALVALLLILILGVWQGVTMDSLKFHLGLPRPTLLRPADGPPLKRPYGHFRGCSPTGHTACGRLPPLWIPHVLRLWILILGNIHPLRSRISYQHLLNFLSVKILVSPSTAMLGVGLYRGPTRGHDLTRRALTRRDLTLSLT